MALYKIDVSTSDDVANATWDKQAIPAYIQADNGFQAVEIAKEFLIKSGRFTVEEIEDNLLFQITCK